MPLYVCVTAMHKASKGGVRIENNSLGFNVMLNDNIILAIVMLQKLAIM